MPGLLCFENWYINKVPVRVQTVVKTLQSGSCSTDLHGSPRISTWSSGPRKCFLGLGRWSSAFILCTDALWVCYSLDDAMATVVVKVRLLPPWHFLCITSSSRFVAVVGHLLWNTTVLDVLGALSCNLVSSLINSLFSSHFDKTKPESKKLIVFESMSVIKELAVAFYLLLRVADGCWGFVVDVIYLFTYGRRRSVMVVGFCRHCRCLYL